MVSAAVLARPDGRIRRALDLQAPPVVKL